VADWHVLSRGGFPDESLAGNTPVLTPQWGIITYTPNFASVIEELGPHPLDDYLNTGATAALAPICTAME